ncbi:MAG TPA: Fe-S cluster assembly protein SufD [Bacteroidota bacterium]
MQQSDKNTNIFLSHFEQFEKSLNGDASSHLHAIRKAAIAKFTELGFPTTKHEEWKYTDVSRIAKTAFKPALGAQSNTVTLKDLDQFSFGHPEWIRVVCVNGLFSKELSSIYDLPAGVRVGSLAGALKSEPALIEQHLAKYAPYDENAFVALSTAFMQDGVFMYIPDRIVVEKPIHVMMISTGKGGEFVAHPRNLIIAGESSQVAFIETYGSLANETYFTNTVTEIVLAKNAVVEHERLQLESDTAFHVATLHVHQERDSNFKSNAMTFGGRLVRNNITVKLDGEGAEATLNGLYLGTGEQHIDNHTCIIHAKPHCPSHELYKGILAEKSKGVFNGKIFVLKDAQKTDAKQTNKNLILSDEASIDTKPQLEIFANDVKCTHGATIGQLDEEALFYLRSRGIGMNKARDLLIYAFASDVIERITVEPLREELHRILHKRLEAAHELEAE